MKKILLTPFVALVVSCAVHTVDKSEYNGIPKGAKSIIVESGMAPDSAYNQVAKYYVKKGWSVKSNKEFMQITPDPKSVGYGTLLKPLISIEKNGSGSLISFSGEWGLDQDGQLMLNAMTKTSGTSATQPLVFLRQPSTKNDVAFQSLYKMAKDFKEPIRFE